MKIIKTYENYNNFEDLDLGHFENGIINKSLLILNSDGTYDYNGSLDFSYIYMGSLTSLLEIPIQFKNVTGYFDCSRNQLISLEGAPSSVGWWFHCDNNELISLQYAPKEVGGGFDCRNNNLLSKVHKSKISGEFIFQDSNPFNITDKVIETVEAMTYEQQMAELEFFDEYDLEASKMLQEILYDLGIDFGTHRKQMKELIKDKPNLTSIGF